MGQIMVRLIRAGSMFVGLEQKKEGSKGKGSLGRGEKEEAHTVPPRLSLSAGFTWIGLFICDRERTDEQITEREEREGGKERDKESQ